MGISNWMVQIRIAGADLVAHLRGDDDRGEEENRCNVVVII